MFTRTLQQVQARADAAGGIDSLVQIDCTILRAHQQAAATGPKRGAIGRTNRAITPWADPEEGWGCSASPHRSGPATPPT
ncbi:hypothetical protein [Streptomyces ochraceiscleroticus]|uniref:Transposase n=1 Tax=Streptomyces ochraceiscleroticus TaxID=47761 RepID=A0ABW1MTE3_9ACTN|nr:hypothetical protein [Streptomyces ochraceiscleroticus]